MKDEVETPKRLVNLKSIKELQGITYDEEGLRIGALVTLDELMQNAKVKQEYPSLPRRTRRQKPADPQRRYRGRRSSASVHGAGTTGAATACWLCRTGNRWSPKVTIATTRSSAMPARLTSSIPPALLPL